MTKEEKAREIISLNGSCSGVECSPGFYDECPAIHVCSGGAEQNRDRVIASCWTHIGHSTQNDSIISLTETIDSLERSYKTAPESCRAEIRDIIEEVVYLRNRISQGGEK